MKSALFLFALLAIAASQEIVPEFGDIEERLTAIGTLQLTCTATGASAPFNINSLLFEADDLTGAAEGVYNGTFYDNDGSFTRVVTTLNTTQANPAGSALTNFLATALRTNGDGDLNRIAFITRYDTVGGVFNATQPCNATFVGQNFTFDFRATYGFYEAQELTVNGLNVNEQQDYRAIGTLSVSCGAPTVQTNISSIMYNGDSTTRVGTYNGTFIDDDGSFTRVLPPVLRSVDVNNGASLTYFVANSLVNSGTRRLDRISYITRYDTVGGVLRAGDCDNQPTGTVISGIPFEASYGFYRSNVLDSSSSRGAGSIITFSAALLASSALLLI